MRLPRRRVRIEKSVVVVVVVVVVIVVEIFGVEFSLGPLQRFIGEAFLFFSFPYMKKIFRLFNPYYVVLFCV